MKTRTLVLTGLFAALTAVGAFIKIPMYPVSLTLQVMFTALAGILLGPKLGAVSQAVYVALGLCGIPIFTKGGGLQYIYEPTFGFLLGLIPMAFVVGLLAQNARSVWQIAGAGAAGVFVLYLFGLPYMYFIINMYLGRDMSVGQALWSGMIIFLPGDALKLAVSALLTVRIRPALEKTIRA